MFPYIVKAFVMNGVLFLEFVLLFLEFVLSFVDFGSRFAINGFIFEEMLKAFVTNNL